MQTTYINLGLPSGRLWAAENEPGHHQFNDAVKTFGKQLPSAKAWEELFDQCSHKWDDGRKGLILTGPNGNTLFLPAEGYQSWSTENKRLDDINIDVGGSGNYWSSSPSGADYARSVYFYNGFVSRKNDFYRLCGFSVRLCRHA